MDVGAVRVEGYYEVLATREQRRAYAQDLLAPLRTPEDQLTELVDVQAAAVPTRSTDSPAEDR